MKLYSPVILLFFSLSSFSQNNVDSSSAERYCVVNVYETMSNKVVISVDYGEPVKTGFLGAPALLKDEETGKRKKFESEVDALNYFGAAGWKMVNVFPVIRKQEACTRYIFKKTMVVK
jgi:hypothetical protein